jgi:hypothetical protein
MYVPPLLFGGTLVAFVRLGEDELLLAPPPPAGPPPTEYEWAAEYGLVCPTSMSEEGGPLLLNGDVESKVAAEEEDEAGVYGIVFPCWEMCVWRGERSEIEARAAKGVENPQVRQGNREGEGGKGG